ncbi:MAG: hypothetical protein KIT43_04540 [Bauldia sp.]|nr:hypothetical protein [Bauldia sp.]
MPKLSRLTRIALLILGVVIVVLTIYTYPTLAGFTTLVFRAIVILGALTILAILVASLLNRKPRGFAFVVLLTSVGVIAFSWSQIAATNDSRVFAAEIAEAEDTPAGLFETIASSRTETAGRVRGIYSLAAQTDREIDALLSGLATPDTPSIAAMFGTTLVTDADTLAAARAAIPAITGAAAGVHAEIVRLLDAERAAIEAFDTSGLPDSARLLFVDAALRRLAAEREIYLALADVGVGQAAVRERMLASLEAHPGAYTFDETAVRARFADPAVDAAYMVLLDELAALDAEESRLRTQHATLMYEAAKELITAAGTTP